MTTVRHVRMTVDLRFEGDYWLTSELVDVARSWISSGLADRDDLTEVEIDGAVLPNCYHCGEPVKGPWTLVPTLAKPGAAKVFHRLKEFPACRDAAVEARRLHVQGVLA